jgi:hypothetical protein
MRNCICRHCERSDVSAEALAKVEAIYAAKKKEWVASSLSLLAMTG